CKKGLPHDRTTRGTEAGGTGHADRGRGRGHTTGTATERGAIDAVEVEGPAAGPPAEFERRGRAPTASGGERALSIPKVPQPAGPLLGPSHASAHCRPDPRYPPGRTARLVRTAAQTARIRPNTGREPA